MTRRPTRAVLRGALVFGAVLVVLLVVWSLGGLQTAPASGTRSYAAGSTVRLERWLLVVQRAELADTDSYGSPQQTTLRIWLRATWTGSQSTSGPVAGLVSVSLPVGPRPDPDPATFSVGGRIGSFDPWVAAPLVLDYTWPPERKPDDPSSQPKPVVVPQTLDVVIRDEYRHPTYLDPDSYALTGPIGHVLVPVRDVRK